MRKNCPKCNSKNIRKTIKGYYEKFGHKYICDNCDHCW